MFLEVGNFETVIILLAFSQLCVEFRSTNYSQSYTKCRTRMFLYRPVNFGYNLKQMNIYNKKKHIAYHFIITNRIYEISSILKPIASR